MSELKKNELSIILDYLLNNIYIFFSNIYNGCSVKKSIIIHNTHYLKVYFIIFKKQLKIINQASVNTHHLYYIDIKTTLFKKMSYEKDMFL